MTKNLLRSIVSISFLNIAVHAAALTIVAPNENTSVSGDTDSQGAFGDSDWTLQWDFAASQFSTVPIGSPITSIGFRQSQFSGDEPDIAYTLPRWDLQLSSSQNAIGSLSRRF